MNELQPGSEEELAELVRDAAAGGGRLALRGGGTRGAKAVEGAVRLSTRGLRGITLYEPGALTLVARAGTPLAEVEAALEGEGQMLAFEPWDARALLGSNGTPTVGGMAAANASGPRRLQAGACRDGMIGLRFVDGTGAVVKNGGRVMKNVTGLDLVKLLAGSRGRLGALTEVAFKVVPAPEARATLIWEGLGLGTAVELMTAATGTPYEVSGAAHLPAGADPARTLLRLEGFAGSVAHRARALAATLARFGPPATEEGPGPWAGIRDAASLAGREGAVWRISVRPTDAPRVAAALPEADLAIDWAGGLVWALAPETIDLRGRLAGAPGHATLVRGSPAARAAWGVAPPEPPAVAALSAGLRAKFDPMGVFGGNG